MCSQLLFVIVIIIIAIVLAIMWCVTCREHVARASINGSGRSKLEARIIAIMEDLTGARFNSAQPSWLRDNKTHAKLELDGYNESLGIALEIQGPGHIKPIQGESYEKYVARVNRDKFKLDQCMKHGVVLIVVDYRISMQSMRAYLQSRLWDAGIASVAGIIRPSNYIAPLSMKPWLRGEPIDQQSS